MFGDLGSKVCMANDNQTCLTSDPCSMTLTITVFPYTFCCEGPGIWQLPNYTNYVSHRVTMETCCTYLFLLYTPSFTGDVPLKYIKNQLNILTSTYQKHSMMV